MMSDPRSKELVHAEELIGETKFSEALKIIESFEKKDALNPEDTVSILLMRANISQLSQQFKVDEKFAKRAYRLAQKNDMVLESIAALLFQSTILFAGELEKANELLLESEKLLNSLDNESSPNFLRQKGFFLLMKSWYYLSIGELDLALESAKQSLALRKKVATKFIVAYDYFLLGRIYWLSGELDTALDYTKQCFETMEELNFHRVIAMSSNLIGQIYLDKGDLNKALIFCKKSLSISKS